MSQRIQIFPPPVYFFRIIIRSGSRSNNAVAKQSKQRRIFTTWRIFEQCVQYYMTLFLFKNVFWDDYARIFAPRWHNRKVLRIMSLNLTRNPYMSRYHQCLARSVVSPRGKYSGMSPSKPSFVTKTRGFLVTYEGVLCNFIYNKIIKASVNEVDFKFS